MKYTNRSQTVYLVAIITHSCLVEHKIHLHSDECIIDPMHTQYSIPLLYPSLPFI